MGKEKVENYSTYICMILKCFVAAFITLAICSKSSFLYPLNNWGDANCYFTVGRGILHGMVPYKDLADQKGPVIFFVYALGEIISQTSFIGIFFIEVICATAFLYYSLMTIKIFCKIEGFDLGIVLAIATATFSSHFFRHGGGPEELSLCIYAYLLYLGIRYLEKDIFPDARELLCLGIGAGLLFWTKFNLCAIFLPVLLFVFVHALKRHEANLVLKAFGPIIAGIVFVTVPLVIYFAINDAIDFFLKAYFYDNLFLYGTQGGLTSNMIRSFATFLAKRNLLALIMLALGFIWLVYSRHKKLIAFSVVSFCFTYIMLNAGHPQAYSTLPLMVFCIFGVCPIVNLFERKQISIKIWQMVCYILITVLATVFLSANTYDILRPKEETVQYIFAREMEESGIEDYSLLYYGPLNEGFYLAADYLPKWRAFERTNQGGTELSELQDGYVNNREPDFIVSRAIMCDATEYEEAIRDVKPSKIDEVVSFENFGYEKIDEGDFYLGNHISHIFLYQKID